MKTSRYKNMKCWNCKKTTPWQVYVYFWETYLGYERPHCCEACRSKTREKKTQVTK